jgi:hypothetical protein
MVSNLIIWSILVVVSYPISRYLMRKGMTLDLTMPGNKKRYKRLGYSFRIPLVNVGVMFVYLCIMLHKFERV